MLGAEAEEEVNTVVRDRIAGGLGKVKHAVGGPYLRKGVVPLRALLAASAREDPCAVLPQTVSSFSLSSSSCLLACYSLTLELSCPYLSSRVFYNTLLAHSHAQATQRTHRN